MFNKTDLLLACEVQTLDSFLIHHFLKGMCLLSLALFLGPYPVPITVNDKLSLKVKGPILCLIMLCNSISKSKLAY